jgi:hypothetical protein
MEKNFRKSFYGRKSGIIRIYSETGRISAATAASGLSGRGVVSL